MSGGKIGRSRNRPSNKRYTAEQRWVKNKVKVLKRTLRRVAKHEIHLITRKPESQRDYGRLQELRQIVSQNLT
jgi:hypothetical protein